MSKLEFFSNRKPTKQVELDAALAAPPEQPPSAPVLVDPIVEQVDNQDTTNVDAAVAALTAADEPDQVVRILNALQALGVVPQAFADAAKKALTTATESTPPPEAPTDDGPSEEQA